MILISSFFTEDIDQVGFKQVIHFFPDWYYLSSQSSLQAVESCHLNLVFSYVPHKKCHEISRWIYKSKTSTVLTYASPVKVLPLSVCSDLFSDSEMAQGRLEESS